MRNLLILALSIAGCGAPAPDDEDLAMIPAADLAMAGDGGGGGCSPACSGLSPHCNATNHCVGCLADGDCAMGTYCKIISDAAASCVPGCNSDGRCANAQKCCSNQCIDPMTDAKNCGGCGMACSGAHSAATCAAGQCAPGKCDPGWGDCNKDPKDGCEANLHADPMNCTACGAACNIQNAYVGCSDGCYSTACKWGFDDCNNNPMDGCETSVLSDAKNCGSCGKSCGNLANAMAGCTNGNCVLSSCTQGYADCDKLANNGCEVKTTTDVNNCGACGNVCPQGNICVGGGCTCPMCNIPNASAKCVNNMCVFDKCNPGFADCDNNIANGCEINIFSDAKNCGSCANVCPLNLPNCVAGGCAAGIDCKGWTVLNYGGVQFCYSTMAGTCQQAHMFCEALGGGYRLFCGDDWQPGKTGEGCGGAGSFTGYDLVNKLFPGGTSIGGFSANTYNCVYGGTNNQCVGDIGTQPGDNMNGKYAFCAPKNYYKNPPDGIAFAQVCGN
jgi:hypothetical protein